MSNIGIALDQYQDSISRHAAALGVSAAIHPEDFVFRFLIENPAFQSDDAAVMYYFRDGSNSAEQLKKILSGLGLDVDKPLDLLEFAAGFGCVTRHASNVLPEVVFSACDIHEPAMQFIQSELGTKFMLSHSVPEEFDPGDSYDVVFALSFFSHMPKSTWQRWLQALYNAVSPGGT